MFDLGRDDFFLFFDRFLILDVFNVTNEANWWTSNTTLIDDDGDQVSYFGELNNPGEPRNYQFGAKFRF